MPITLNCPKCHKPFRVRDESIGGRVRCPSCGAVLQVPSALSPASHFGDEPRPDGGSGTGTRPMAEDYPIGASRMGGAGDVLLGAAGREGAVDLNPPATGPGHGPPSIRSQVPGLPPPAPASARAPAPQPPAPKRIEPLRKAPLQLPGGTDLNWGPVKGGLGMIRWALLLCALVFVGFLGHGAWCVIQPDSAMKVGPGFLGKEEFPRWKEVMIAYTAGPLVPAALLLLLGRCRCAGAPSEAHARSLALGAAFFTLVGLLAGGLYAGMEYFDLGNKLPQIPPVAKPIALIAIIPSAVLADVLTLFFIGQIGWSVGRPGLQRAAASVIVYPALLVAGVLIGHLFYPVLDDAVESWRQTGSPLGAGDDDALARRVVIWAVIVLSGAMLFFLRYAAVAGGARRAVRRRMAGEA